MSPHDSLAVHPDPSERSPTLPSSSGLCVRQIENEQQSTVGEVSHACRWRSWRLHVDWLAQTTLYQVSQAQTAGWVKRNKKKTKNRSLFQHFLVQSSYILDVVGTFWMLGSSLAFDRCLTVTVVSPVRSTHDQCTRQASDMTCNSDVIEKPSRALAGRRPTARWCCLRKLIFVRLPLLL